jgi:hypothetical protein
MLRDEITRLDDTDLIGTVTLVTSIVGLKLLKLRHSNTGTLNRGFVISVKKKKKPVDCS